jgi:hypothetical protein
MTEFAEVKIDIMDENREEKWNNINDNINDGIIMNNEPTQNKTQEELNKIKTLKDVYHIAEFINLIEMLVKTDKIKSEITIELDQNTRDCFMKIIKENPEFFGDFEKTFILILEDNKIDIDDVPHLTLLISKLFKILTCQNNKKISKDEKINMCSTIIKFIIHILVKENKINIGSFSKEEFLDKIEKSIDSCIDLIKLNIIMEPVKCGCFFNLFKK